MRRIEQSDVKPGTYLIIVAEGLKNSNGEGLVDESAGIDAFGHKASRSWLSAGEANYSYHLPRIAQVLAEVRGISEGGFVRGFVAQYVEYCDAAFACDFARGVTMRWPWRALVYAVVALCVVTGVFLRWSVHGWAWVVWLLALLLFSYGGFSVVIFPLKSGGSMS